MKSFRLLPWLRSWSKSTPILHGILIAQLIMLPCPSSQGVWVDVDSDGDGVFDSGYEDGTLPPEYVPPPQPEPVPDSDGDHLSNADEAAAGSSPYNPDSDGDGITDAEEVTLTGTSPISIDSNSNGVSDYNEFYGNTAVDTDISGPGVTPYDFDGDTLPDPVDPDPLSVQNDPDSDGDYVPDSQDTDPYNPAEWNDANNNGTNDDAEIPSSDTDGDGVANDSDSNPADPYLYNDWNFDGHNDGNEDWDSDGVSNLQDSHPNSNCLWCDWNGNGVNDDVEAGLVDSDGDGYADRSDSHPFSNTLWDDWNSNGWNDSAEFANFDGDAQPDSSDSDPYNASLWDDWNHNGINDSTEVTNSDGDSQPDASDSDPQNASLWEDWNHNGINDSSDPPPYYDMDDDGINDDQDSDPQNSTLSCDWNRNGINDYQEPPPLDQDQDSHPDSEDSDPGNAQLWEDWNHNGYNDSIENQFLDDDNDSRPNAFDTNPQDGTLWNDHNANGINDENEITITDTDGDGYDDARDTHVNDANLWNDHNGNGINDELELPADRDGDSIADDQDEFPDDFDNDGLTDADEIARGSNPGSSDTDGDGLNDGEENYAGTNLLAIDTDGDGLTDYEELRAYQSDPLTATTTEVSQAPDPASAPASEASTAETQTPANSAPADSSLTLVLLNAASPPTSPPPTNSNTDTPSVPPPATTPVAELKNYYKLKTAASWALSADLADEDGDGIPNAVEKLYAPMEVTPDGDLDGDKVSNLDEYKAGTDLNGASADDFDGDGINDLVEEMWPGVLSKYRYADAYEDPDMDGLLTIEELNASHGTRAKVAGLVATNPRQQCSSPIGATYNVATRTPPKLALSSQDWTSSGIIPPDYWFYRDSVYASWMTDGSLRRSILERINARTFSATNFFTKQLLFDPPLPLTFKSRPNYGSDHLPLGYVQWLKSRGLSVPPFGGRGPVGYHKATRTVTKMVMGVNGLLVPQVTNEGFLEAESPSPMPSGILASLDASDRNPSPSDIDGDGMPNAWEARYGLNFRSPYDANLEYRAKEGTTPEQIARVAEKLALYKNEFGLIREFPTMYVPGGKYNQEEWTMMDRLDHDHDGLPNLLEYKLNSNPLLADLADIINRNADKDHDGFSDLEELLLGTDPADADSDPGKLLGNGTLSTPPPGSVNGPLPPPNEPFKLVWDAPRIQAEWSKMYYYNPFDYKIDSYEQSSMSHYASGSTLTDEQFPKPGGGKTAPKVRELIPSCQFPSLDAIVQTWMVPASSPLQQCYFRAHDTYSSSDPKFRNGTFKYWNHARARVVAQTPSSSNPLTAVNVNLSQGTKVTYLRTKTTTGAPPLATVTQVLGTYTFTIPPGECKSEVFPTLLSFPFTNPPDSDSTVSITYNLLPVEVMQTQLAQDGYSVQGGLTNASTFRLARWQDAWDADWQTKPDFIASDRDRVQIRIPSTAFPSRSPGSKPIVKIFCTGDTTELEMNLSGDFYESEPFLFVADADDDESYNGKAGFPGTKVDKRLNDQTISAAPGQEVKIEFENTGGSNIGPMTVGYIAQPTHTISCELVLITQDGNVSPADSQSIDDRFQMAAETFAQVGVKLEKIGAVTGIAAPVEYWNAIVDGKIAYNTPRLLDGQIEWFGGWIRSKTPSVGKVLKVIFVVANELPKYPDNAAKGTTMTVAGYQDLKYALVCIDQNNQWHITLAHEIGHYVGLGHPSGARNLMTLESRPYDKSWLDSKRFRFDDERILKTHMKKNGF